MMDRRGFLKLALAALGAIGIGAGFGARRPEPFVETRIRGCCLAYVNRPRLEVNGVVLRDHTGEDGVRVIDAVEMRSVDVVR